MYLNRTRSHHDRMRRFSGLLTDNPVLTLGLALPFAISASYSLQAAVCVLIGMAAVTVPMLLLSSLVGKYLPPLVRTPLWALCAMAILIPVEAALTEQFPVIINSLGVYFPIIAVNTLMIYFCSREEQFGRPLRALWTALMELLGFALVMGAVACVRELFGNGTLWGVPVPAVTWKVGALLIPFGGLIVIAFLAAGSKAAGRLLRRTLYRRDLHELSEARRLGAADEE